MSKGALDREKLYCLGHYNALYTLRGGVLGAILKFVLPVSLKILPFFLHETHSNDSSYCVSGLYRNKMDLIWREREHEEQDLNATNDLSTIQALRYCGLLKILWLFRMRQQMELLEYLV